MKGYSSVCYRILLQAAHATSECVKLCIAPKLSSDSSLPAALCLYTRTVCVSQEEDFCGSQCKLSAKLKRKQPGKLNLLYFQSFVSPVQTY